MKRIVALSLVLLLAITAMAFDPPAGGDGLPFMWTPYLAGGGMSVASLFGPGADYLNPSASGLLQRVTLDVGYLALTGLGTEQGLGTGVNLGIAIPQPYGVWTFGLNFLSSPPELASLPIGTLFGGRIGLAKDVYPNFLVGLGVRMLLGSNGNSDWGLGADIGVLHLLGKVGFLQNARYGIAVRNMGKGFAPVGLVGYNGTQATAYDSPFTLALGFAGDLFNDTKTGFRIGSSIDFYFPTFQNLVFATGIEFAYKNIVSAKIGWDINVGEAVANVPRDLYPSFSVMATIPISRKADDSFISQQGWDKSELQPIVSARPLYNGIWSIGGGATMPLGVVDKTPPKIADKYPETKYDAYYMSPNNDGVLDTIEIPITITDSRYVKSYSFKIYNEAGELVRTIVNKEALPESVSFSDFFKRLIYVKKGIPIPQSLIWNGINDAGAVVPDGVYFYEIEAVDDNGNKAVTERKKFIIDNTHPEITINVSADSSGLIFSPDGDGNKDILTVKQSGSSEDLWKLEVIDLSGTVIRTIEVKNSSPGNFVWDGKDNADVVVPDGIYSYRISATDRAGNVTTKKVDNIIINTQQPPVGFSISTNAFSPNGDTVKDTVTFTISVPVKTGLSSWSLSVLDSKGTAVWELNGNEASSLKDSFVFAGLDSSGKTLPEGQYQAKLAVKYVNGHSPEIVSPLFTLDVTRPNAVIKLDRIAFNPLAGGDQQLVITQTASKEDRWIAAIINAENTVVRSWTFIDMPEATLIWDGADDNGKVVKDGLYRYKISAVDRAGNEFSVTSQAVTVDTAQKQVRLALDKRAFSPNNDKAKDDVVLLPEVASNDRVRSWSVTVVDEKGTVVRTFKGTGKVPDKITWDGKNDRAELASDGLYTANLEVQYITNEIERAASFKVMLDTTPPQAKVSTQYLVFSPNGDKQKDTLAIEQDSVPGDDWEGAIIDARGTVVKQFVWKNKAVTFEWDGTDNQGNKVPDGTYSYRLSATDAAGNKAETIVRGIVLDTRTADAYLTVDNSGFSPNGTLKTITVGVVVTLKDGVDTWKLAIVDDAGKEYRSVTGKGGTTIPATFVWDGKADTGLAPDGTYKALLTANYTRGDRLSAASSAFVLDSTGPKVAIKVTPELFSPDNDGVDDELQIALSIAEPNGIDNWRFEINEVSVDEGTGAARKERGFFSWSGRGKPADRLTWDGRSSKGELVEAATDYLYRLTVVDMYGNRTVTEGMITTDVLVIRDGDRLKIKVPSIVFRAGFADFKDLTPEIIARNDAVLRRIAQILNRFKEYNIRIEGHANNVSKINGRPQAEIDKEEREVVIPLSEARARAIMQKLIQFGVDPKRLSVLGRGSSEPVVSFTDAENRWKNRRVEFILIK